MNGNGMGIKFSPDKELLVFAKDFIADLSTVGITSISSRELQGRVLEFILKARKDFDCTNYFELSKSLLVPESKLKKMIYEVQLRDISKQMEDLKSKDQRNKVESKVLGEAVKYFRVEGNIVILEMQDEFAKNLLKNKLRALNHITDSSFNPELVKIEIDAFIELIKLYLPEKHKTKKQINEYKRLKRADKTSSAIKNLIVKAIPCGELLSSACELISTINSEYKSQLDNED